nr:MAG TPA: hypothetical protein [Caudoviricetes sp.]
MILKSFCYFWIFSNIVSCYIIIITSSGRCYNFRTISVHKTSCSVNFC